MTQYDTVHLSPNLTAAAYIVHPPKMTSLHEVPESPPKELFLVEDIQNSIADHEDYTMVTPLDYQCQIYLEGGTPL